MVIFDGRSEQFWKYVTNVSCLGEVTITPLQRNHYFFFRCSDVCSEINTFFFKFRMSAAKSIFMYLFSCYLVRGAELRYISAAPKWTCGAEPKWTCGAVPTGREMYREEYDSMTEHPCNYCTTQKGIHSGPKDPHFPFVFSWKLMIFLYKSILELSNSNYSRNFKSNGTAEIDFCIFCFCVVFLVNMRLKIVQKMFKHDQTMFEQVWTDLERIQAGSENV